MGAVVYEFICAQMAEEEQPKRPVETGILHQAHSIDFGARVIMGIAAVTGAMGSLSAQIYGQLGFGPTLILAAILALLITQMPLVIPWGRRHFLMWHSKYPWISTAIALILVIFVLSHDYAERLITPPAPIPASLAHPASVPPSVSKYTMIPPISGNVALELIQAFHLNFEREDQRIRRVFITAPQNQKQTFTFLQNFLYSVQSGSTFLVYNIPDPEHWVNAPKLMTPETNGIVLHGMDAVNRAIDATLQRCFFVKHDTQPLAADAANRLIELGGFPKEDPIIWIAVGAESPVWKETTNCAQ
jgi:hypothetical protein